MNLNLSSRLGRGRFIASAPPPPFSAEALNYFSRLDAAGDTTYVDYKYAIANYIDSLVTLGGAYWDTMKTSALFVGVGFQGCFVPLRDGMNPLTNFNFVSSDQNVVTGLKGNAVNKYIRTNTVGTNYAQNDTSISVYSTSVATAGSPHLLGSTNKPNGLALRDVVAGFRVKINAAAANYGTARPLGLCGGSRTGATTSTVRGNKVTIESTIPSVAPIANPLGVFCWGDNKDNTDARLATYHAGPALDLATLEGLQETLIKQIAAI